MNELIQQLVARTGLNEEQARQVAQFLKENASKIPEWIPGLELPDGLKNKLGGLLGN